MAGMRDLLVLFVHLIVAMARLAQPGGLRSVVAESVLVRHQLLVMKRGRKRVPTYVPGIGSSSACARCSCVRHGSFVPPLL